MHPLMTADRVLRAFAAMSPAPRAKPRELAAGDLLWLGQSLDRTAIPIQLRSRYAGVLDETRAPTSPFEQAGLMADAVHPRPQLWSEDVLDASGSPRADGKAAMRALMAATQVAGREVSPQLGWVVLVGNTGDPAKRRRVCMPLVTCQVEIAANPAIVRGLGLGGPHPDAIGEWELSQRSDWVAGFDAADPQAAAELLDAPVFWTDVPPQLPSAAMHHDLLVSWVEALAAEAGVNIDAVSLDHPALHEEEEGITACLGWTLLQPHQQPPPSIAASLSEWSAVPGIETTAFAAVVGPPRDTPSPSSRTRGEAVDPGHIESHLPLTTSQRRVLEATRHEPVVVVSGAPGTGKSHLVAAIAADAASRGDSVLIATRSNEAGEVLANLLLREPGPVPIRFGSPAARQAALAEIERRLAEQKVSGAGRLLDEARRRCQMLREQVSRLLQRVDAADRWSRQRALAGAHREAAPGLFGGGVDLDRVAHSVETLTRWPNGWRSWRARRWLRRTGRCSDHAALLDAARTVLLERDAHRGPAAAAELEELWTPLAEAEVNLRHWVGRVMDDTALERAGSGAGRRALSSLHAALRAGPASRRRLLAAIPPDDLVQVAPLWLGTLGEVDELLPRVPGLFQLVILDEASQIDQPTAAPALLRGRRTVIVGDPRQLRHVSFVSDDSQAEAFTSVGMNEWAGLDVRRNSVLDVAAGVAAVRWLAEHHRSVPHLIGFSLSRFYDGVVTLATRHPGNETLDAIDIVAAGADPIETVIELVGDLDANASMTVGVITPFRELADSISAALRKEPDALERIERLKLQVGTVHEFQGSERDVMIVVPGLTESDNGSRRSFVVDPHLFNVMVTRARERVTVVTDLTPAGTDLLADYLRWGAAGPQPVGDAPATSSRARRLAAAISDAGGFVRSSYPVGEWSVDLCLGTGDGAVGLICGVHPDGIDAHIERHLALMSRGWKLLDPAVVADADVATRAIELARRFERGG